MISVNWFKPVVVGLALVSSSVGAAQGPSQDRSLPFSCTTFSADVSAADLRGRFGEEHVQTAPVPWGGAEGDYNEGLQCRKMRISLNSVDPGFSSALRSLLVAAGEKALALEVDSLNVINRCRCGDDFCATFYTQPLPAGAYGPSHRNVALDPKEGMIILDVVDEHIACVEVLYNEPFRQRLLAVCP